MADRSYDDLHQLTQDLDRIYESYSRANHPKSPDPHENNTFINLPVHISSTPPSLNSDIVHSAPQSDPQSLSLSFDFTSRPAMSNDALNLDSQPDLDPSFVKRDSARDIDLLSPSNSGSSLASDSASASGHQVNTKNDWNERGAAVKDTGYKIIRRTVQDFEFGKRLGEGSYSTVVLATDKITSVKYAVKILDKRHIIKEKKVKYVNIEKHALNRLSNRMGIISLYFTFQDKDSLYFVLDYASNGELLSLIKKHGTLNEDCVRYFGAQILDSIKFMHENGVIHRDIKPENILLDDKFRIQITDFGTAKLLEKRLQNDEEEYPVDVRAKSFVGTAEYVSPELLENKYCGKSGDIWAFGCIVYQMIAGKPPFKAANEYLTFQKITKLQYAFSAGFPTVIRDLIKQILVLQPSRRASIQNIQDHYFFQSINFNDFDQIWNVAPPELGPYKMSAKSMMKVPELTKSASSQSIRKVVPFKRVASEPDRSVNPASAAAFVLKKDPDDRSKLSISSQDTKSSIKEISHESRELSRDLFIPGTTILRPTITSLHSYSRVSPKAKPRAKSTIEVTPITPLEMAWQQYLHHSDERIIKLGPVIATKLQIEQFERKYRGLIQDIPLGTLRSKTNSFLSQVVNGNGSSLRGLNITNNSQPNVSEDHIDDSDESDAIVDFLAAQETLPEEEQTNRLSKLLKRLGISKDKDSPTQHPLEKSRTCTMIVTSHGRVLVFFRNDPEANYRLINELKIWHKSIAFKEILSTSNSKLSRLLPTTGIFAISSKLVTFTFEVEKYEVSGWTESLVKAQANQIERLKKTQRPSSSSSKSPNLALPQTPSPRLPSPHTFSPKSSPNLSPQVIGPEFNQSSDKSAKSDTKHDKSAKKTNLFNAKVNQRSIKRKPPPPLGSPGIDMSTGLSSSKESGMLHAAQLAVNNSAPTSSHRRSSFTKDHAKNPVRVSSPTPGGITSMNSKFLARSTRKK